MSEKATALGQVSFETIFFFVLFIVITMGITYWASKKTKTAKEFYAAGRLITGFQNGLALAGAYMSAAAFLGIAGLVATSGYDGLLFSVGWLVGWPVLLLFIAEPLRNLGKFTYADVVAYRLSQKPVRICASIATLITVIFYLIPQMVGGGTLIRLLLGLPYEISVVIVGIVTISYILFGGMLATTWVQIIKAGVLIGGATLVAFISLFAFNFDISRIFNSVVARYGEAAMLPGLLVANPLDTISLGLALMIGVCGLPHILMRFYTVPDQKAARKSVAWATGWIGYFFILTFIIGYSAASIVGREVIQNFDRGGNMSALLLAEALGGTLLLGVLSAVAFATILAVVAGLTLAGAAALAHDFYVNFIRHGTATEKESIKIAKLSTLFLGIIAITLGIVFKGQNVAFLVGLAFAIAASANFPALFLSMFWRKFTTGGAVASQITGLFLSVGLIVISPTVMVDILKNKEAIFPLKNPGIISLPAAFIAGYIVSLMTPEKRSEAIFMDEKLRTYLGVGAED
jgi:cation/acetate symporter